MRGGETECWGRPQMSITVRDKRDAHRDVRRCEKEETQTEAGNDARKKRRHGDAHGNES